MSLDDELTMFRESFYSIHAVVENGYVVYKCKRGFAKNVAEEANKLIEQMNLSLVAIPTSLHSQDSVCVQSNLTEA